jgi:hypothetical protein
MRVGDNFDLGWIRRWLSDYNDHKGLRLSNRYTISVGDVLAVPRTPLLLLAIENKQEQDEQANNSRNEIQRIDLNHKLGS